MPLLCIWLTFIAIILVCCVLYRAMRFVNQIGLINEYVCILNQLILYSDLDSHLLGHVYVGPTSRVIYPASTPIHVRERGMGTCRRKD